MLRTGFDRVEHESMVRQVAEQFEKEGYTVLANIPGYPSPQEIDGHVPDVAAVKGHQMILIEVETATSYKAHILTPIRNLQPFLHSHK